MAKSLKTVLIVDASVDFADNLREILEHAGYATRLAATGAAATKLAESEEFAVALIDILLPDGDGGSVARSLKALRPSAESILFVGFPAHGRVPLQAGIRAYLTKPCAPEDILYTIEDAMRQSALREENQQLSQRILVSEKLAAVGTLTAGLSHEIRNPLNSATLHLTLLERRIRRIPLEYQAELIASLASMREEIHRLNDLVRDFLQFAQPREFAPAPVDLTSVADSVRLLLEPQAAAAGLTVEHSYASARLVAGDAEELREAILNLLLNAIQATPGGGRVLVEIKDQGDSVALAVEDSGPGVPSALHTRIFEPFFTTKETGTGLGLPIVHAIAQRHGGGLILEAGKTSGARFVMKLPAIAKKEQTASVPPEPATTEAVMTSGPELPAGAHRGI